MEELSNVIFNDRDTYEFAHGIMNDMCPDSKLVENIQRTGYGSHVREYAEIKSDDSKSYNLGGDHSRSPIEQGKIVGGHRKVRSDPLTIQNTDNSGELREAEDSVHHDTRVNRDNDSKITLWMDAVVDELYQDKVSFKEKNDLKIAELGDSYEEFGEKGSIGDLTVGEPESGDVSTIEYRLER